MIGGWSTSLCTSEALKLFLKLHVRIRRLLLSLCLSLLLLLNGCCHSAANSSTCNSRCCSTSISTFIPAPTFGRTEMSRTRFEDIWSCLRWGDQPSERPGRMSSEQHRWLLVDDFVEELNENMVQAFDPSEHICVDESISRWYGQGGHWTNMGLPMYVAIDHKPENGCEIQNATCGQSGFMLRLKLVKTAAEESTTTQVHNESLLHGTAVLKFLVSSWRFTGRILCADSYFASVGAAEELKLHWRCEDSHKEVSHVKLTGT
ncbi:transposase IS4 [Nitzschia inconspicua]|uniref:Transposase IS4 n=1 Tax=Nitzschia inconspicua TaxID=303405 RepID=A0A9K3LNH2_9STRA|nr:transposase IS4 [Nitzschia inconspicua]